jgi:hypothetical protein
MERPSRPNAWAKAQPFALFRELADENIYHGIASYCPALGAIGKYELRVS